MITLVRIPEVMGNYGFRKGQRLMETWFSRRRAVVPYYSQPVTDVITMDWVLRFGRAKKVFDKLVAEEIWANRAAWGMITKRLWENQLLDFFPGTRRFGDLTLGVPALDKNHINFRAAGSSMDQLDDLTAALGAFTFRLVVAGTISKEVPDPLSEYERAREGIGWDVTIDEVGIYVRDSYDFEGAQLLGWWADPDDPESRIPRGYLSQLPFRGGELVSNSDFNIWRNKTGWGGDFEVFSDLKRLDVSARGRYVM